MWDIGATPTLVINQRLRRDHPAHSSTSTFSAQGALYGGHQKILRHGAVMMAGIVAQQAMIPLGEVPHRYWRVFIVDNNGQGDFTTVARIEMYSSAMDGPARTDRCVGGTAIYSSQGGAIGTEPASNAFNDNNGEIWGTSPSGAARLNCWIGYDFGSPIAIDRFALQSRSSFTTQTPKNFRLEYSDDNATWTTLFTPAAQSSWANNEQRLFTAPAYSQSYIGSPHGSHRYWRVHCGRSNSGGDTYAAAEVEMRATPGGSDQCSGGTATAHSNFSGTFDAPKAFDNNAATLWSASGGASDGWLKYDFGSAVVVAEVMIQARNDASFTQTPRWGCIEFSDDNAIWNTAWEYAMPLTYSAGLAQVTTDPAYV